ncbi:hypothetical protein CDAR_417261 [Caerostris darwini]|uniref:Uncharacterized protein n=1 Tax=Caerostris darwini TaxID=1538125 RepID=A0AAV4X6T0_9ARAC|nr:hypothetical protein CDAR_417261 [Caerostris darwini]
MAGVPKFRRQRRAKMIFIGSKVPPICMGASHYGRHSIWERDACLRNQWGCEDIFSVAKIPPSQGNKDVVFLMKTSAFMQSLDFLHPPKQIKKTEVLPLSITCTGRKVLR